MLPRVFRFDCEGQPEAVRSAIRNALVGWFEPREAPRGWIVGPVMCLWRTAHTNDDTVFALILQRRWKTRITGFSLYELARPFFALLLLAALVWLAARTLSGDLQPMGTIPLGLLCLAMLALVFVFPKDTREPRTVGFLRRVAAGEEEAKARALLPLPPTGAIPVAMSLIVSGRQENSPIIAQDVTRQFRRMEAGQEEFLILEAGAEHFVQTAPLDDGYTFEWRDGAAARHFQAQVEVDPPRALLAAEALSLMLVYLHGRAWPDNMVWHPLYPSRPSASGWASECRIHFAAFSPLSGNLRPMPSLWLQRRR